MFGKEASATNFEDKLSQLNGIAGLERERFQAFVVFEVRNLTFIRFNNSIHPMLVVGFGQELSALGSNSDASRYFAAQGFSSMVNGSLKFEIKHAKPSFDTHKIKKLFSEKMPLVHVTF